MAVSLEILPSRTKKVFDALSGSSITTDFYLAGGTGLALQLKHRESVDLDFFSQKKFDESKIIEHLSALGHFQLEKKGEQTVVGILDGVKVSFLGYRYPLINSLIESSGAKIADGLDIVCMKIDAIAGWGAKRDFIDVYFGAKELIPLNELLLKFEKKYADLNYNMTHIKKSLVYFDDAEQDPMPKMIKPVEWKEIKKFFEKEIGAI